MATEYLKFKGKAKWAKVYEADEFRGARNWKIDLYLDEDELKRRSEAGIQSKVYEDADGKFVQFKRPQTKLIKGVNQLFSGPIILDHDGKVLVEYKKNDEGTAFERVGTPVLIGNGSVVEVTVAVYDTQMGKGQRLESVKIIDLIEYKPENEGNGEFRDSIVITNAPSNNGVKAPW